MSSGATRDGLVPPRPFQPATGLLAVQPVQARHVVSTVLAMQQEHAHPAVAVAHVRVGDLLDAQGQRRLVVFARLVAIRRGGHAHDACVAAVAASAVHSTRCESYGTALDQPFPKAVTGWRLIAAAGSLCFVGYACPRARSNVQKQYAQAVPRSKGRQLHRRSKSGGGVHAGSVLLVASNGSFVSAPRINAAHALRQPPSASEAP